MTPAVIQATMLLVVGIFAWYGLKNASMLPEAFRSDREDDHADLRAALVKRMNVLLTYLKERQPNDPRVRRLLAAWAREVRSLSRKNNQAGKTIDKSIVYICLLDAEGKPQDENTAFFVLIHELAHVATDTYGHTPEFWNNMRFLLHHAIKAGVYRFEDYGANPKSYCGQPITGNPYQCVRQGRCDAN